MIARHPALIAFLAGVGAGALVLVAVGKSYPNPLITLVTLPLEIWWVAPIILVFGLLGRFAANPGGIYRAAMVVGGAWSGLIAGLWMAAIATCAICSD